VAISNAATAVITSGLATTAAEIVIAPNANHFARAEWVEKRTAEVLSTHYFHLVFSVPEQIASIAYQNKAVVYGILFRATPRP
jgi:hypothetical protein